MNQEELKAEIKAVLDYNRYTGPVAAFSDGNVFLLLGQEQVNGAVNYAKASGLAIHLVNGDDDDITTIEGLLKVNTFGTRAPATEETAPATDAETVEDEEPVEDEAAIALRKQQEEQAAADSLGSAGAAEGDMAAPKELKERVAEMLARVTEFNAEELTAALAKEDDLAALQALGVRPFTKKEITEAAALRAAELIK